MSRPDGQSLKVVVQRVCERVTQRLVYRLIAYNDCQNYHPAEFETLDGLLQAFRAAVPNFDERMLSNIANSEHVCCLQ